MKRSEMDFREVKLKKSEESSDSCLSRQLLVLSK